MLCLLCPPQIKVCTEELDVAQYHDIETKYRQQVGAQCQQQHGLFLFSVGFELKWAPGGSRAAGLSAQLARRCHAQPGFQHH